MTGAPPGVTSRARKVRVFGGREPQKGREGTEDPEGAEVLGAEAPGAGENGLDITGDGQGRGEER